MHKSTPATVDLRIPASSFASSANFASAGWGSAEPSALNRGLQSDSSRVSNPVPGTVCSSCEWNRACPPPLSKAQPLITRHLSLRAADSNVAPARTFMLRFASRYFDQHEQPAIKLPVISAYTNRRLNRVGADLDQKRVQLDDLLPRHGLDIAFVCDAAEQYAAFRIGQGSNLVR